MIECRGNVDEDDCARGVGDGRRDDGVFIQECVSGTIQMLVNLGHLRMQVCSLTCRAPIQQ